MLASAAVAPAQAVQAQAARPAPAGAANLNISPRRVIFTGKERSAAVYVFNQGTAPVTVDVALVDNIMLPSGEIIPLSEAKRRGGEALQYVQRLNSAADAIIATPSRLTLPAGGGKTVRLRAVMPEGDAAKEYRTHLTVTSVPPPESGLTAEQAANLGANELQFNVRTNFGISIPLILRVGNLTTTTRLGAIAFAQDPPSAASPGGRAVLVVPLERDGARSIYGNIEVRSGAGKNAELVGAVRGIGVYPELTQRVVRIPLQRRPKPGEALTVSFLDGETTSGTPAVSESFTVP